MRSFSRYSVLHALLTVTVPALTAGCGDPPSTSSTDAGTSAADAGGACVPDRARWDSEVRSLVQRQCGSCHGDTPAYGAPYSLLDYEANLRPASQGRRVDRIAARLMAGSMPPPSTPAPPDEASRSIVEWASCGAQTPTPGTRLRASAPVFRSPERSPTGLQTAEFRAPNFPVGPEVQDLYQCFTFDAPVTDARFVRRFEMIVENPEVIHHVVLLRDPNRVAPSTPFRCTGMPEGSQYLYAWAPGQNALEFPEGGLRMTPGQRFVMQIHYNNGAMRGGITDRSGVRLYLGPPQGTEYGMVAIGPSGFNIPARATASPESACTLSAGARLLTGMPHMHNVGTAFEQWVERSDRTREPLVSLQGWRFESQLFYELPRTFAAGDRVITRCTFTNTTNAVVRSGHRTVDEMCFNFAYVTPPPGAPYCDEAIRQVNEVTYSPGACARPGAPTMLPLVTGSIVEGSPAASTGGTIPNARWVLSGIQFFVSSLMTPIGRIDQMESALTGRGQVWTESDRFTADMNNALLVVLPSNVRFSRDIPISFAGTPLANGNTLSLTQSCPTGATGAPPSMLYTIDGNSLSITLPPQASSGVMITPRYSFTRAP